MRSNDRARIPIFAVARLAAISLLILLGSCSPREHDNPFDPENPDSHGHPDILAATAGDGEVRLEWGLGSYDDLQLLRLVRSDGRGGGLVLADSLPPGPSAFTDTAVTNDSTYAYRLEILFRDEATIRQSREALATPGRRVLWVLDQRTGGPTLVSPDARRQVALPGSGVPSDLDVHPFSGEVTAADFYEGRVERFDRRGALLARRDLDALPLSVAVVAADSTVWVGCHEPSRLLHLSASLTTVIEADTGVGVPEDLAWDNARGHLWVADSDGGRLLHRWPSGGYTALGGFERPFSVAVDPSSGDAWLVDRAAGVVHRVDARADTILFSISFLGAPYTVIADPATGGAWVTDSGAGLVWHLAPDGGVDGQIGGLRTPAGIAIDPGSGDLWVTDATADQLVRLNRQGGILARLGGFSSPFAVVAAIPPGR